MFNVLLLCIGCVLLCTGLFGVVSVLLPTKIKCPKCKYPMRRGDELCYLSKYKAVQPIYVCNRCDHMFYPPNSCK